MALTREQLTEAAQASVQISALAAADVMVTQWLNELVPRELN
jgi:hypothetical protein